MSVPKQNFSRVNQVNKSAFILIYNTTIKTIAYLQYYHSNKHTNHTINSIFYTEKTPEYFNRSE